MFSPLSQFDVIPLFKTYHIIYNILTNVTIFLIIVAGLVVYWCKISYEWWSFGTYHLKGQKLDVELFIEGEDPESLGKRVTFFDLSELTAENIYVWNSRLSEKTEDDWDFYIHYTNFLFLFVFIFYANLIGLIPYTYTITSSLMITFFIALKHYIMTNFLGLYLHEWKLLKVFLPGGVPEYIIPLFIGIEFVSYLAKVFSLTIRLFANMLSGHALLKIYGGFAVIIIASVNNFGAFIVVSGILGIVLTLIIWLETIVAYLQAYVFTTLIVIYLRDVTYLH